jgi:hypothetical protein
MSSTDLICLVRDAAATLRLHVPVFVVRIAPQHKVTWLHHMSYSTVGVLMPCFTKKTMSWVFAVLCVL